MADTCVCFPSDRSMCSTLNLLILVCLFDGFGTKVLVTKLVALSDEKVPSTTELSKANLVLNAADA